MEVDKEEEQPSEFLTYLPSLISAGVGNHILEYIVTGHGGPQAILNLRKVHSQTQEWIDTLSWPTMTDRIFIHIPFTFTLNAIDVRKFQKCPPPTAATSMILKMPVTDAWYESHLDRHEESPDINISARDYRDLLGLLHLRVKYPEFFSFWNNRLQSLKTSSYDEALLALGSPKYLRHLDCLKISDTFTLSKQILSKLNTLKIRCLCFSQDVSLEQEIEFYTQLSNTRNLTRLEIEIFEDNCDERREQLDDGTFSHVLEGIRRLIDIRREDKNFHLSITFRLHGYARRRFETVQNNYASTEDLKNFVTSITATSSSIQVLHLFNEEVRRILSICELAVAKDFFKNLLEIDGTEYRETIPLKYLEYFTRVKKISVKISSEDDLLVEMPNSIETLRIETFLFPEMKTWPKQLRVLYLDTTCLQPAEWIEGFRTINDNCPLIEKLWIKEIELQEWNHYQWSEDSILAKSEEGLTEDWFKNLRSLDVDIQFGVRPAVGMGAVEQEPNNKMLVESCLLRVLRVQELPLQKLHMTCRWNRLPRLVVSKCVESLLTSPLKNSLISTNLDQWFTEDAKKAGEDLMSAVTSNKKLYEERYGRVE